MVGCVIRYVRVRVRVRVAMLSVYEVRREVCECMVRCVMRYVGAFCVLGLGT